MTTNPPTDPSLRRGIKTSEGLIVVGTALVTWTTTALALLGQLEGALPEKYNVWLVVASSLVTAVQSAAYSLARGNAKAAAAAAVPHYLAVLNPPSWQVHDALLSTDDLPDDAPEDGEDLLATDPEDLA